MWEIRAERLAFIEPDGSLHDVLIQRLTNTGSIATVLDGQCLPFFATDSESDHVIAVSDGLAGNPRWEAAVLHGEFTVVTHLRGSLGPGEALQVGVHLHRDGRVAAWPDRIHFFDPCLFRDVSPDEPVEALATLVFPATEYRRVVPEGAVMRTSRAVAWRWRVCEPGLRQMSAYCESGSVSQRVRRLDDGLALAYRVAALCATGEADEAPTREAHDTLLEMLSIDGFAGWEVERARASLKAFVMLDGRPPVEQFASLRTLIEECTRARDVIASADASPVSSHVADQRQSLFGPVGQSGLTVNQVQANQSSPWRAGAFYLLVVVVLLLTAGVAAFLLPALLTPVVFIFALVVLIAIAAITLRSTDSLSEARTVGMLQACLRAAHLLSAQKRANLVRRSPLPPEGS